MYNRKYNDKLKQYHNNCIYLIYYDFNIDKLYHN